MTNNEESILNQFVEHSFRAAIHPYLFPHIQDHPALAAMRLDMAEATQARNNALAAVLAKYRWKLHEARERDGQEDRVLSRSLLDEARAGESTLNLHLFRASLWISSIGPDREAMELHAATIWIHPTGIYDYIDAMTPFMDRVPKSAILQIQRQPHSERLSMMTETANSGDPFLRVVLRGQPARIAQERRAPDFWIILYRMTRAYWSARSARNAEMLRDGIPLLDAAWLLHVAAQCAAAPGGGSLQAEAASGYLYSCETLVREMVERSQSKMLQPSII